VNGDEVEYFPEEKRIVARGNIYIEYNDIILKCDNIIVNTDTKDADAEGNIILKTPTGEIRGERILYNFETKRGEILKPKIQSGDWYAGGERLKLLPGDLYEIENGYVTSCDLDQPHYRIRAKNVTMYPDNTVVAKNVTLNAGRIPVAFLPRYNCSLKTGWPTIHVIPGKKKTWGIFALTSYRYELDEEHKLTLRIDEREKWGLGEGIDYKYAFSDDLGEGLLRTYYTHQRNRDRNESIMAEEERYRVQLRHRLDVRDNIDFLFEYHKLSDEEMSKDFFYREEYDRESSPESYLYLLARRPEYSLNLLTRKRTNHFQGVIERLPELRFDLKDQRLFDKLPFYFKTDMSFTNLNSKQANSSAEDSHVIRLDTYNRLSSPLRLVDFLSISPFLGMRDTFYAKYTDGDEDKIRTAFYTGIDISTKFYRTYGTQGRFLGVDFNKIHHTLTPSVEYEYIHEPSTTPGNLQQFDDVDSINRKSTFTLGLENRVKTKRLIDGKLTTFDVGYLLLNADYLDKPENGSRFSNVKGDLEFTPYNWLRVESDTQYDPATRDFQNWNADLYINKSESWRLGFGSRYWQDTEHELTAELFYKLNNNWAFRFFGRYDLKEIESDGHKIVNRFDSKEITVIKDLHCWLAEVSFDVDRDGGTTLWLALKLKASPKVPFDFKDYYAVPKE